MKNKDIKLFKIFKILISIILFFIAMKILYPLDVKNPMICKKYNYSYYVKSYTIKYNLVIDKENGYIFEIYDCVNVDKFKKFE